MVLYFTFFFFLLTSKGSAVALVTPWYNLLVMLEPRFTCGPDPRILCNTLKALACVLPMAAPSLAISVWTSSSLVCTRNSPERQHTNHVHKTVIRPQMHRLLSISFTSTIHSLVLGCGSSASDIQESLTKLSQDRVLDPWRYKSHTTTINYNLSPHQLKK